MENAFNELKEHSIGHEELIPEKEGSSETDKATKQESQEASCEDEKGGVAKKRQGKEKKVEDPLECCMLDESWVGQSAKVCGWVDSLRRQGKLMFMILRYGIKKLQCVFSGDDLCNSPQALTLTTGCSVELWGKLQLVPEGKMAIGGLELNVTKWNLVDFKEGSSETDEVTKQESQEASCEDEKGGVAKIRQGKEKKDEDPLECCMLDESRVGQSVKVFGWVDTLRRQGKLMFMILRFGIKKLQCVFSGDDLCKSPQALTLTTGCSVELWGKLQLVPEGKKAIGGLELNVTKWNLVGSTPPGEVENLISDKSSLLYRRYLMIRDEKTARVFTVRYEVTHFLREYFHTSKFIEVTAPLIVQTQAGEGSGSAVFEVNFHGEEGQKFSLTQSSQLYLEAVSASLGNVYCIMPSYRAEPSQTPLHLSEFTLVKCEYIWITFDELLGRIEDLIVYICKALMDSKFAKQIRVWNPELQIPKKPFRRMDYADAIAYLKQHNITKDDGKFCEMGENIPHKPKKELVQKLKEPTFLTRFSGDINVKKCPENRQFTESVDLLLPGVGEVVGASMHNTDEKELKLALLRAGMDPKSFGLYTAQQRCGTRPHGGFGLGLERLLCWLLKLDSVKDVSLVGWNTP